MILINVGKAEGISEGFKLCGLWKLIVPSWRLWKNPLYGKLEKVVLQY